VDFTVLLINPPNSHQLLLPMDSKKVRAAGHKPPLGIMYLGAYLRAHTSATVELLDAQLGNLGVPEVVARTTELRPDLVGITTWTDFWYDICRLTDGIKNELPSAHISLGGPHLGIYPRESLTRDSVDSIVIGDGEVPLAHLVRQLEGHEAQAPPGLYLAGQEESIDEFKPYVEPDVDSLPFPDRTMLRYREYDSLLANGPMTTMVTSRGCPFRCTFCKLHFQKTLLRSPENVVAEMAEIAGLGIKEIEFYDDTFGMDRDRVLEICQRLKSSGLKFDLTTRDRVSNVDDQVLRELKSVGLKRIFLGVESASNETLRRVKKGTTVEQAREAIQLAKKHGIETMAYFMIGLPGEELADFERTLDFALEAEPDYVNFSVTIPYPGTEMYQEALEKGTIKDDLWLDFVRNPTPDMRMPVYEERYSRSELLSLHKRFLRRFYFRPQYVFSRMSRIRSARQLLKSAKAALSLWSG